jgi:cell division protein FtsI/penicillin-binding protein 2
MGFGARTGIDLAGEATGLVNDPSANAWREIDLANGSFGQGVGVTQIQLAAAYAAMMNGGTLVTPHVVASVAGKEIAPASRGRVLDASMTPELVDLMNHVVTTVPFYRQGTLIPGYWVGGKTGTAQIWDNTAHAWKANIYNFSFVGYIGRRVGHPDLVIAVRISEGRPTSPKFGQLVMPIMSFELFRRIATDAITTPGLLPDLPVEEVPVARAGG